MHTAHTSTHIFIVECFEVSIIRVPSFQHLERLDLSHNQFDGCYPHVNVLANPYVWHVCCSRPLPPLSDFRALEDLDFRCHAHCSMALWHGPIAWYMTYKHDVVALKYGNLSSVPWVLPPEISTNHDFRNHCCPIQPLMPIHTVSHSAPQAFSTASHQQCSHGYRCNGVPATTD